MQTTRMPGFTAEASIYRRGACYIGDPTLELRKGEEGMISPAAFFQWLCSDYGPVRLCCWAWDTGQHAGHYCFEQKLGELPRW
jgi:hypothetical protein